MPSMDAFEVLRVLRGAIYGRVVLARHRRNRRLYAIKMMSLAHMRAQRAVSGPRVLEDGDAELQILRRISGNCLRMDDNDNDHDATDLANERSWSVHPRWRDDGLHSDDDGDDAATAPGHHHVLTLEMDFVDPATDARCLVFEYCPYGELYDQLERATTKTLGVETARGLFRQLATALRFIHDLGIAHRDVSLENVLIDRRRQCRLGDFGLAAFGGRASVGRVGKTFYMAPEVYDYAGEQYDGLAADMWSLGIVLFILVTGVPPFETPHDGDARFRLVRDQGLDELLRAWRLESRLPLTLRDLLDRLLRVEPRARLTIGAVWEHPWLDGGVDVEALVREGRFSEHMVEQLSPVTTAGEATTASASASLLTVAADDGTTLTTAIAQAEEPQLEIANDVGSSPGDRIPTTTLRDRKRIKITIDGNDSPAHGQGRWQSVLPPGLELAFDSAVGGPPPLRHESPSADGFQQLLLVPPRASPIVWPKVSGTRMRWRGLFRPRGAKDVESMMDDDGEHGGGSIEEDGDGGDQSEDEAFDRRPRLQSSSSCSSSASASSVTAGGSHGPPISPARCRFCLEWVSSDRCGHHVTLPTLPPIESACPTIVGRVKTRRVCDACFEGITRALADDEENEELAPAREVKYSTAAASPPPPPSFSSSSSSSAPGPVPKATSSTSAAAQVA